MYRYWLALIFGVMSCQTLGKVTIQYIGNVLEYPENPRIENVLSSLLSRTEFYWPNSAIFNLDATDENTLKNEILQEISTLIQNSGVDSGKRKALVQLESQITSWNIASRVPIPIDYDLARVRDEHNPKLDDGSYALYLPFRPNTITVFGLVSRLQELPHLSASHVNAYDEKIAYLDYADAEYLYVIHPNGESIKVSKSFYETRHIEVPPGGSIYVPLKELPFLSTNTDLNNKIVKLAGSRLP